MIDQASELRQLVQQWENGTDTPECAAPRIIAVTGGKGGVGTTTVAIQLATAMTRQSDRVLLVDADPDRTDVATLCGIEPRRDLADLAQGRRPLDAVVMPGPHGVSVIGGTPALPQGEPSIDRFHRHWIAAVLNAPDPFDYVIVDTGNGSSESVKKLWEVAELVLLVTTPELPSVLDAYASVKTLADRSCPPSIHTLINQNNEPATAYDVHGRLARAVWRFLGFHLDSAGHIGLDSPETMAQSDSPLSRDFGQLARTVRTSLRELARRRAVAFENELFLAERKDTQEAEETTAL